MDPRQSVFPLFFPDYSSTRLPPFRLWQDSWRTASGLTGPFFETSLQHFFLPLSCQDFACEARSSFLLFRGTICSLPFSDIAFRKWRRFVLLSLPFFLENRNSFTFSPFLRNDILHFVSLSFLYDRRLVYGATEPRSRTPSFCGTVRRPLFFSSPPPPCVDERRNPYSA